MNKLVGFSDSMNPFIQAKTSKGMCGMSNLIKIELVYLGLFEIELI